MHGIVVPQLSVNKIKKRWIILRSNDIFGFVGDFITFISEIWFLFLFFILVVWAPVLRIRSQT